MGETHGINASINFDYIETRESSVSIHPKKEEKGTPQISIADLDVMPIISVREWMLHTSHMLIYDWFPLTYFTMAAIISPKDSYGCYNFAMNRVSDLLYWVYAPILLLRFLGLVFMNKRKLIIYQIAIIYGFMLVALTVWESQTITGMRQLPKQCFRPLGMSSLNLVLMVLFYLFVLTPLYTIALFVPLYIAKLYKDVKTQKRKKLLKHYVIKAMPSILFRKELF